VTLVADSIARALRAADVDRFFLLTGGDQALWIALHREGIPMLLGRSEQGAVYMADGYARVRGRPALTYGQHGPGAANVAAALADAWWAGSPVVALTSAVPLDARAGFPYQYLDQQALFAPVVKWQREASDPMRATDLVVEALHIAASAPTGPVHLDVPRDVMPAPIDSSSASVVPLRASDPAAPDSQQLTAAARALASARRPLILAGAGVVRAGAWHRLGALAETHRLPVGTTPGGKGAFPEDHPLALGVVGRYSRKVANDIATEADVVLVLGSRLGSLATVDGRVPSPEATVIQVDIDESAVGVTYPGAVPVIGDIGPTLEALMAELPSRAMGEPDWTAGIRERVKRWQLRADAEVVEHRGAAMHPGSVTQALRACLARDDVLVADTGYMAAWAAALFPIQTAGRTFLRAAGSLGWALPGAIGATLGTSARVACVVGDGGVGYNLMELETAARARIPTLVVVLNNRSLAFEYHEQRYQWKGEVIDEANDFTDIDYAAVARNLGAEGRRVTDPAKLIPTMHEALESGEPWLIDAVVDKEAMAPVTNFENVLPRAV
jgi:acetolactate synthase-1/2/3 large subunit